MLSAKLSEGSEGKRNDVSLIPPETRMARCLTGRRAVGGPRRIPFVGSLRRWLIRGRLRLGLRTRSAHGSEEAAAGEGEGEVLLRPKMQCARVVAQVHSEEHQTVSGVECLFFEEF